MEKKIDAMYAIYGRGVGICGNCPHFKETFFDTNYFKCSVYGMSRSESTDWRKKWNACGLIDKHFPVSDRRIVETIRARQEEEKPLPGQMTFDDLEGLLPDTICPE